MHPIWSGRLRTKEYLRSDFIAGLTTAILLIPQAMAYATLAGLPPVVGLYGATLPLLVYAALGSSRVMAVGPVALISLMTATALAPFVEQGASTAELIGLAGMLALLVGAIQLSLGLLKVDFITDLLDKPVLTGFTAAAALLIAFSQFPALVGAEKLGEFSQWNWTTLAIGGSALGLLWLLKRIHRGIPAALVVIILATLAVIFFGLDTFGVKVVGEVPPGLPSLSLPPLEWGVLLLLLPAALAIALVSYLESFAVARALATGPGEKVSASREWIGVGAANLTSALVGSYPLAGGFSRSAVNDQAGAKSRVAGAITAVIVMGSLAFLTPLFTSLPRAALAAIIVVAVSGLFHVKDWKTLKKEGPMPFGIAILTFGATLIFNIEIGLLVGVLATLLVRRLQKRGKTVESTL